MIKIVCPLYVMLPRKKSADKKLFISMNSYGNVNTHTNNQAKKIFKEIVSKQLEGVKINGQVNINYQLFKPNRRKRDKMNVIAVVSKYLLDAITELGCWEDDNDEIVQRELLLPTVYDKDNGRVEVTIYETTGEDCE